MARGGTACSVRESAVTRRPSSASRPESSARSWRANAGIVCRCSVATSLSRRCTGGEWAGKFRLGKGRGGEKGRFRGGADSLKKKKKKQNTSICKITDSSNDSE